MNRQDDNVIVYYNIQLHCHLDNIGHHYIGLYRPILSIKPGTIDFKLRSEGDVLTKS